MKEFDESFHTNDFDREMLDFIKENYNIDTCNGWYESVSLCYHPLDKDFFILTCTASGNNLTKQEFKEKIGMVNKTTFTKDDLVAGKHIVEYRDGCRRFVMCDDYLIGTDGCSSLGNFDGNLISVCKSMDIVKVYEITTRDTVDGFLKHLNLNLVWERTEKSEAQLQYEECQAKMKELQAQLDKLEPQIK